MKPIKTIIPGITEIHTVISGDLPAYLREQAAIGITPFIGLDKTEIPHTSAHATTETTRTAKGDESKSTLTFITSDQRILFKLTNAFIIITADGSAYILGAKEAPTPKIKIEHATSTAAESKAAVRVSVEWESALIRCAPI